MKIHNVNDASFKKYGKILKGYPVDKILKEMQHTPLPDDVIYVSSVDTLEAKIPEAFCGLVGENITLD